MLTLKSTTLCIDGVVSKAIAVHNAEMYERFLQLMSIGLVTNNGFIFYILPN